MSLVLDGHAVSRGIVIAPVVLLHRDRPEVRETSIPEDEVDAEIRCYAAALALTRSQLEALRTRIPAGVAADISAFIDTYLLMLEDGAFRDAPVTIIRQRLCTAEWALQLQRDELVTVFEAMDDPYLQTRKDDVDYMVGRLQGNLRALKQAGDVDQAAQYRDHIVVADDFTPEDVVLFHQGGAAALVSEAGGVHSHAAILARSLGLPAVVACYGARELLLSGETVLLDASVGILIAEPAPTEEAEYRSRQHDIARHLEDLSRLREGPALSRDGQRVSLQANIEMDEDLAAAVAARADGVGLLRTEMYFIERSTLPDEETQYHAYLRVLRRLGGCGLTIRTLDLGADKLQPAEVADRLLNPALGMRSIRYSLHQPEIFAEQLSAILRVSAHGPVRLLLPMLTSIEEVDQVFALLEEQRRRLRRRGQAFDPALPIGGMIEVPAAALLARAMARHFDFLSIGTNDLIQYTLAVDRLDDSVGYLYNPLHPAVIRLVRMTIEAGREAGIPVAICGEIAGDTRFTRLLLALGLREFSMSPAGLLEVKDVIRHSDIRRLEAFVSQLDELNSAGEVMALVAVLNACS